MNHGWWPGVNAPVPPARSSSGGGVGVGGGGGVDAGSDDSGVSSGGGAPVSAPAAAVTVAITTAAAAPAAAALAGTESIPQRLALYRALHQLACACVLPPGTKAVNTSGGGDRTTDTAGAKEGESKGGAGGKKNKNVGGDNDAAVSVGGVAVFPTAWAEVGDTVDAAVEATVLWLLGGGNACAAERGGGRTSQGAIWEGATAERALEVGRVYMCVCWMHDIVLLVFSH